MPAPLQAISRRIATEQRLVAAGRRGTMSDPKTPPNWGEVRALFPDLERDCISTGAFILSTHPWPVREAIERHRRGLDENSLEYLEVHEEEQTKEMRRAVALHLGTDPDLVALTDSTTMGLALVYGGFRLREGDEVLTTIHDHYSSDVSLQLRADRTGCTVRRVSLYDDPATATSDGIVDALIRAVTPRTRLVAITWVHTSTGVRLPVRRIADAIAILNDRRDEEDRVFLSVDGLHGLGVHDFRIADLGCDVFVAGCHKWLHGPRGTGFVWAKPEAWRRIEPWIPTFEWDVYRVWTHEAAPRAFPEAVLLTAGGYRAFEHWWALPAAFAMHERIGRGHIEERLMALNQHFRDGVASMPRVTLHTPRDPELSSGVTCLSVEGRPAEAVVEALKVQKVIASVTPYKTRYARMGFCMFHSLEEVEAVLRALRTVASA